MFAKKRTFYDPDAEHRGIQLIKIPGIISIERDTAFDDTDYYRSGGIRLYYKSFTNKVAGLKEGILLEAGFDDVIPLAIIKLVCV